MALHRPVELARLTGNWTLCANGDLLAGSALPQLAQAVLQFAAEDGGRVGIECDEIPERLAAIFREPRERGRVGVRMARYIFADRGVGMLGQASQRFGSDLWVLADQAEQVVIGLGRFAL